MLHAILKTFQFVAPLILALALPLTAESNEQIDRVAQAIEAAHVGPHDIHLEQKGSSLEISGFVISGDARDRIESVSIANFKGEKVDNNLVVDQSKVTSAVSAEIASLIESVGEQEGFNVLAKLKGDVVYLSGYVSEDESKKVIEQKVASVGGIKEVKSSIVVRATGQSDAEIKATVEKLLNAKGIDTKNQIQILANEGVVTLAGDMESQENIDETLSKVLMVDGVKDIESKLTIGGLPYQTGRSISGKTNG